MSTTVKLDAGVIASEMEKRVIIGINKALPILLAELKRLTPEDTGNMLDSYVVKDARVDGNTIVGEISNDADYAIYVERGVGGVAFKYHKPKGTTFYEGIGNRTFARAVDNVREQALQIIYTEIDR